MNDKALSNTIRKCRCISKVYINIELIIIRIMNIRQLIFYLRAGNHFKRGPQTCDKIWRSSVYETSNLILNIGRELRKAFANNIKWIWSFHSPIVELKYYRMNWGCIIYIWHNPKLTIWVKSHKRRQRRH